MTCFGIIVIVGWRCIILLKNPKIIFHSIYYYVLKDDKGYDNLMF